MTMFKPLSTINPYMDIIEQSYQDDFITITQYIQVMGGYKGTAAVTEDYYMKSANMIPRFIQIDVREGAGIQVNPNLRAGGSYMYGDLDIGLGIKNLARRVMANKLVGESIDYPVYYGNGTVVFPPELRHFAIVYLQENEKMVVDSKSIYLAETSVQINTCKIVNKISAMVLGNKGLVETELTGPGVVVIAVPCPTPELHEVELIEDKLYVNGDFAIARFGDISFKVEPAGSSIFASILSGNELVNSYHGTGKVWLYHSQPYYKFMDKITGSKQ